MRHKHTRGVQVIGWGSGSDSEDGRFHCQKAGRRVLIGRAPGGRGYGMSRDGK